MFGPPRGRKLRREVHLKGPGKRDVKSIPSTIVWELAQRYECVEPARVIGAREGAVPAEGARGEDRRLMSQ